MNEDYLSCDVAFGTPRQKVSGLPGHVMTTNSNRSFALLMHSCSRGTIKGLNREVAGEALSTPIHKTVMMTSHEELTMYTQTYILEQIQDIPRDLDEVFAFFSTAQHLEMLTPHFLHFRILTPLPIDLRAGALLDYRLKLFRIPFRWRTLIEVLEPPHRFIDTQLRGPYRLWRHVHEFQSIPGGTRVRDRVEYALPLGPVGRLTHRLLVRRLLEEIFAYRRQCLEAFFAFPLGPREIPIDE